MVPASEVLPMNVVAREKVYKDLEVAFVITEDGEMFKALCRTVELLQGSTAIISQYYYGCLFHELLAFQLADRHPRASRNGEKTRATEVNGVSSLIFPVLSHAELSINESDESSLVHMDIDQSFLPITTPVKTAIFESFARQNITESETDVTDGIRRLVSASYGFPSDSNTAFVYAGSPLELFANLVNCCAQEGGTLCFPSGSNGNYVSSAKFLKANVVAIPTDPEEGYKLTEETLSRSLETVGKPWVYISGPTINPTGLIYSNEEINKLISVCAKFGAKIILDTSFSGVEYNSKGFDGWNLRATLEKISTDDPSICVCLLGGLFFKMLASGLKFGFLLINQPSVADAFHCIGGVSKPHSTIKYTVKKLLDLAEQETKDLSNGIAEQMEKLRSRFTSLKQTLEDSGWEVLDAEAGVSVLAKPSAYLGKTVQLGKGQETKLDDTNIREAILGSTGLCINSAAWTGIPGYCRFTIALADEDFKRALDCITHFKSLLL